MSAGSTHQKGVIKFSSTPSDVWNARFDLPFAASTDHTARDMCYLYCKFQSTPLPCIALTPFHRREGSVQCVISNSHPTLLPTYSIGTTPMLVGTTYPHRCHFVRRLSGRR